MISTIDTWDNQLHQMWYQVRKEVSFELMNAIFYKIGDTQVLVHILKVISEDLIEFSKPRQSL